MQSRVCVNGQVSVRPIVCPVDRRQQRHVAGLLLSALRAVGRRVPAIDRYLPQAHVLISNAGSVMLRAEDGGSTQTSVLLCLLSVAAAVTATHVRPALRLHRPPCPPPSLPSSPRSLPE